MRQEGDGLRRYCHVGTGNYNPKTARLYEDLGLLTADPQLGEDLTKLFNKLSGYAPKTALPAAPGRPASLRAGLRRADRATRSPTTRPAGRRGCGSRSNSMVDEAIIDALYRASQAGVPVDVVVRGICALRPGRARACRENIRVRWILGRFLEHSRIFRSPAAATPVVWIGSADLMHRNLDRRVEALVRIADPGQLAELTSCSTCRWTRAPPPGTSVRTASGPATRGPDGSTAATCRPPSSSSARPAARRGDGDDGEGDGGRARHRRVSRSLSDGRGSTAAGRGGRGGPLARAERLTSRSLLVHRPAYRDWSWPKGSLQGNESLPAAAVREVLEETGIQVALGRPLPTAHYVVGDSTPKSVRYWAAQGPAGDPPPPPRPDEVDVTRWVLAPDAEEARQPGAPTGSSCSP